MGFVTNIYRAYFMNEQLNDISKDIISAISNVPVTIPPLRGDRAWTTTIKRALMELGKKNGYDVCGLPPECEREWLYDMVWYRNVLPGHLREIGLVLESEWHKDPFQIRYDFEKLLIAKSPKKVMVFRMLKRQRAVIAFNGIRLIYSIP